MGSRDLLTDLALGVLAPAAAVRAADGQAANPDAQAKVRRRPRPEDENDGDDSPASETREKTAHQLDHLA
jgi:uncharacterized membrane protein